MSPQQERLPVLRSERLVLRELREDDARALFAVRSDAEVMRLVRRPLARSEEDALAVIRLVAQQRAERSSLHWAITRPDDDTLIGMIGLWRFIPEHFRAELGYLLARSHWGQGLMSEAVNAAVEHAFHTLELHSVEAHTNPANAGSIRVLEKCGFTQEAHFRENVFWQGAFLDTKVFSKRSPISYQHIAREPSGANR
jgi:ribosomal-protein-alanine N-acetyltransferase